MTRHPAHAGKRTSAIPSLKKVAAQAGGSGHACACLTAVYAAFLRFMRSTAWRAIMNSSFVGMM